MLTPTDFSRLKVIALVEGSSSIGVVKIMATFFYLTNKSGAKDEMISNIDDMIMIIFQTASFFSLINFFILTMSFYTTFLL